MGDNKDWKPEVGKTAWAFRYGQIMECSIKEEYPDGLCVKFHHCEGLRDMLYGDLFPTAEAALASIKVYDLEGKEVVVTRASEDYHGFVMSNAELWQQYEQWKALEMLIKAAYKVDIPPNPEGEARLKAAQERFKNLGSSGTPTKEMEGDGC